LRDLVRGGEHSLYEQSYRPREMITGTVNVDGFGVGWYVPEVDPTPVRFVSAAPMWADPNFDALGAKYSASCALAASP
jgi:glutamine amidotransferase